MKKLELSIIIPCYNSEATLKAAVESCYIQGLAEENFEIILVDDGSRDTTREIIDRLVHDHKNIISVFHERNQGGGMARNTAVSKSHGEIIFCLDSDDLLPSNTLLPMMRFLREKNADGVTFQKSIKFKGDNINNIDHIDESPWIGSEIPFESFFNKPGEFCPLVVTFMYTRAAYDRLGGYPTTHGSDTQGFAWRFLCADCKAYTCPDTKYLHRVNFKESYYLREYHAGKMNYNWREILLEHYYVFSPDTLRFITRFNCMDFTRDFMDELGKKEHILKPDFKNELLKTHPPLEVKLSSRIYIKRNSILGYFFRFQKKLFEFTKKLWRHAYSLFVGLFLRRSSRSNFHQIHEQAKKAYLDNKAGYDFKEYVVPQWQENMNEIERYFENDFSFSFLNHPVIRNTMFMYTLPFWKNIQKTLISSILPLKEIRRIITEYNLGKPFLNDFEYRSSGNNIHHLYHLLKFFKETSTDASDMKTVVEVGGGYGNMAKIFKMINPHATYIIIDIPIFSYLQCVYLKTIFGEDAVHMIEEGSLDVIPGKFNIIPLDNRHFKDISSDIKNVDLFVSTWALSESNDRMQELIKKEHHYFNAVHILLAYQKSNELFNFAEDIQHLPTDYKAVFNEETEYLPRNYYLFAKKS